MKKIYPLLSGKQLLPGLVMLCFALGLHSKADAQVYYATLSGANELPPVPSGATGKVQVTIDGNSMTVKAEFSGTFSTTAAHIHAPTAVAGEGTASVATTTPSFPGFPLGVTSGTMDQTFDMTLVSSYRAGYLTANGGTPATAFAALKAALDEGKAYFNIHSAVWPGGEIRGFLTPCPAYVVTIPDAYALPSGTAANTVYPGYAPASSITLSTMVSGGTSPYSYAWDDGTTESMLTVSPVVPTTYGVTVTDANGCKAMGSKMVYVVDVTAGKNMDKTKVCHKGTKTLEVSMGDVADHLAHGDMLGECAPAPAVIVSSIQSKMEEDIPTTFSARLLQNPSAHMFTISITGEAGKTVGMRVFDFMGRPVEIRMVQTNSTIRVGSAYPTGTYMMELVQGAARKTLKLVKIR